MHAPSSKIGKAGNTGDTASGESRTPQTRELLTQNVRKIVRARELFGRGPNWARAWKRALWRYTEMLQKLKEQGK